MEINLSGFWRANLEKSRMRGPEPKAMLARIKHNDPELIVEIEVTRADGSVAKNIFKSRATGEELTNNIGGIEVRSCSRWEGRELLIESWMKVGERESHFRDYWSLSSDGQLLTMEHRADDLAGQITLLEKADELE